MCSNRNTKNPITVITIFIDEFFNILCEFCIIFCRIFIGESNCIHCHCLAIQINSSNVEHVFQKADSNCDFYIGNDLNYLSFAAASGFKITIPADQAILFKCIQILAYCRKSHLQILHDLQLGSLFFTINILIDFFTIYFF